MKDDALSSPLEGERHMEQTCIQSVVRPSTLTLQACVKYMLIAVCHRDFFVTVCYKALAD